MSRTALNTSAEIFNRNITLAIQAGGFSTRMGQDKALLPFGGLPLIEFIANRGKTLTDDLLVTTNQVESFEFLDLPLYPDRLPQRGTLTGMHTALSAAQRPLVAVIGCDMPFFSPSLLAYQAQKMNGSDIDAVVPRSRDGLEPLHGVYRRDPCLKAIYIALEKNIHSLIGWFELLRIIEITEEQIRPYDPDSIAFMNLNTLEEYHHAEELAALDQKKNRQAHGKTSF
jgi:molybdopterin-guanine dinucleotide biosynthesis protein A